MKVAFLDQSGQLGGAELLLLDMIPHLRIEPRVVLLEDGPFREALHTAGIPVQTVERRKGPRVEVTKRAGLLSLLLALPAVWKMASRVNDALQGAALIYANTPKAWVLGALAARRLRVPLICHLHDIISEGHFSRFNRMLLVQAANWTAHAVIANSEASARAFVQAGGHAHLIKVIPNGFDLEGFHRRDPAEARGLRTELGIGRAPLIAMIGRLAPWKGQHVFIEAISQTDGAHGVVVGHALFTAEDHAYADGLPALAASLGCADRMHFLGFRRDVVPVLHEADIVAHCSIQPEPFGRVIVEAMLCGRAVVVSGEGGAAEIVDAGVTGLHHVPGDASSLASRLRELLHHPARARAMGLAAERVARDRYSLSRISEQTMTVLKSTLLA
jgi:glycosyltransferase involved in cell wall biosynthesis